MEQNKKLEVSLSPHVRTPVTTQKIMLLVVIALLPACVCGVLFFGWNALLVLGVSAAVSVLSELLYELIMKKPVTIGDLSALVTGILIGLNMPPSINAVFPAVGAVFAIIVVKQLFGGLGKNFINPALAARCFMLISFSEKMTDYTVSGGFISLVKVDAVSGATPLSVLKTGELFDLKALFFGNIQGSIGETSAIAILVGAAILLIARVISPRIPLVYIGTFSVAVFVTALIRGYSSPLLFTLEEVLAGGLMLGAWFMATDYVTSPVTKKGQYIYAALLGILTFLFRMIGKTSEGTSYAIIFMNCLVPLIEHYTRRRAYGVARPKKEDRHG